MEEVPLDNESDHQRFDSVALDDDPREYVSIEPVNLTISIESFQIIEERIRKHVSYKITGEENNSKFEIYRRYKEFRILHKLLLCTWPGCFVPNLPPKKAMVIFR